MNRPARLALWIAGAAVVLALIVLAVLNAHGGSSPSPGGGY
jgi:hypothetical protein